MKQAVLFSSLAPSQEQMGFGGGVSDSKSCKCVYHEVQRYDAAYLCHIPVVNGAATFAIRMVSVCAAGKKGICSIVVLISISHSDAVTL